MVLLTGCSSDDDGLKPADNDERVPLEIAAGINSHFVPVTRAVETAWEEGDQIGVFVTAHNASTIYSDGTGAKGFNRQYTFNDGTNYETWGNTYRLFSPNDRKVYLPSYGIDIFGIYPYRKSSSLVYSSDEESNNPTVLPSVPVDVSIQTSQKAIDLMQARTGNISNSSPVIELLFYHRLTKLVFNLKQGEGLLPNELKDAIYLGMTIDNQHTTAKYDIYNDAFIITSANPSTIVPIRANTAPTGYVRSFEAIVLPNGSGNAPTDREVTITFYQKSEDQIVNRFIIKGDEFYFRPGYKYTFNVTVNALTVTVDTEKYTEQW